MLYLNWIHNFIRIILVQTLAYQDALSSSMEDFEKLSGSKKLQNLSFHILDCGTYASEFCDPQYFDVQPLME